MSKLGRWYFTIPLVTGHYLEIYVQPNVQDKIMVRLKSKNMCLGKQLRVIGLSVVYSMSIWLAHHVFFVLVV